MVKTMRVYSTLEDKNKPILVPDSSFEEHHVELKDLNSDREPVILCRFPEEPGGFTYEDIVSLQREVDENE